MERESILFKWLFIASLLQVVLCTTTIGKIVYDDAEARYGGGTGEPNDPYLIYTAEQMNTIGIEPNDRDKHFKLMADIDLSTYSEDEFNIIGTDWDTSFKGVFDGNGYIISNFSCKSVNADYTGLFGHVGGGIIRDLRLIDVDIDAETGYRVGSLVGYLVYGSELSGCSVQGGTVTGGEKVGGLVGYNGGKIINCYASCIVDGNSVGGLAGYNVSGVISCCYSTGIVTGNNAVGGLVGQNGALIDYGREAWSFGGDIDNCYSTCDVTGNVQVGGMVGFNYFGDITWCYSIGSVSGNELVGGFAGDNDSYVNYCFWDIESSGLTVSAAGIGKTTVEMQTAITYIGWNACGPFWTIDEGIDYPHLAWENMPGEFIAGPTYGGGTGTAEDPYLIYTAEELNNIGLSFCDWDKHFKLMADIDLSQYGGEQFNIIGIDRFHPFIGVFDGNGHTISHLTIVGEGSLGLFRQLGTGAEVRDLGVVDVNIVGSGYCVGAIAGHSDGDLINCFSSGTVSGGEGVGGLVGTSSECALIQCYSTCQVSGVYEVGGLVGSTFWSDLMQCYSTGTICGSVAQIGGLVGSNGGYVIDCFSSGNTSGGGSVGGLIGSNRSDGNIISSYSKGYVNGNSSVGGLVGYNHHTIKYCYSTAVVSGKKKIGGLVGCVELGTITECYSAGLVQGQTDFGGLIGGKGSWFGGGNVNDCFWDMETSGLTESFGGTGKTTAEMQTASTFLEAGWDFINETENGIEDIWMICEGRDYPRLQWENVQCEE